MGFVIFVIFVSFVPQPWDVSAMTVKAIVFDFDGVLADSEMLHLRVYRELLGPSGVTISNEEYCERYLGFDDEGVFQQVALDYKLLLGDEEIELLIAEKARRFEALVSSGDVLYPTAAACVRRLARGLAARHRVGRAPQRDRGDAARRRACSTPSSSSSPPETPTTASRRPIRTCAPPNCTACRRVAASRSRTRTRGSTRRGPPACARSRSPIPIRARP